ncbi:hypothetical protein [Sporosarcina sp. D27]|uniref:hypothetical protein n=1 Tax=Sporosarcina sp. D27 TaxID=1382305 RepID=UPI00047039DF|nr:hypothetical protein [Sporosarcina sp. D27]
MNTLEDVKKIMQRSFYETAAEMQKVEDLSKIKEGARIAELRFAEGLQELEKLKLSKDDRRHFKLLREAYLDIIKSIQYIQKGNHVMANRYSLQSGEKAFRYAQARMRLSE